MRLVGQVALVLLALTVAGPNVAALDAPDGAPVGIGRAFGAVEVPPEIVDDAGANEHDEPLPAEAGATLASEEVATEPEEPTPSVAPSQGMPTPNVCIVACVPCPLDGPCDALSNVADGLPGRAKTHGQNSEHEVLDELEDSLVEFDPEPETPPPMQPVAPSGSSPPTTSPPPAPSVGSAPDRSDAPSEDVPREQPAPDQPGVKEPGPNAVRSASGEEVAVAPDWNPAGAAAGAVAAVLVGLLYFFTRLNPDQVLGLPARRRILEGLRSRPWSTRAQLGRALRMRPTTLAHHLRVLRRHGHVVAAGEKRSKAFALRGEATRPATPSSLILLARETQTGPRRLSDVMRSISLDLGISRFGAWKAVKSAASRGRVQLVRSGRGVWVHPAPPPGTTA